MSTRTTTAIVAAFLVTATAGLIGLGCERTRETADDGAPTKTTVRQPASSARETVNKAEPGTSGRSDRPTPGSGAAVAGVGSASSAVAAGVVAAASVVAGVATAAEPTPPGRAASSAGAVPGPAGRVASAPNRARSVDPYPRPQDVPLAPMGHKKGPSPLTKAPGYYPADDPEAESFLTGRRHAAAVDIPFTDGESSPERLALAILDALRTNDSRALHALRVTESEYAKIMWPEFPESRPICNSNAHDTFFFLDRKCHQGVGLGLSTWGGQDLQLEGIAYAVGRAPYLNFTLYHGVQIHIRRPDGEEAVVKFVQAFAEHQGIWKIYNYQDKE